MQILKGSKRDITIAEWDEQIAKAKKRLADSKKCYELFGEADDMERVKEDKMKLSELIKHKAEAILFMDTHNIK